MAIVFILSAVAIAVSSYWLGGKSGYADGVDVGYWYGRTDGIPLAKKLEKGMEYERFCERGCLYESDGDR